MPTSPERRGGLLMSGALLPVALLGLLGTAACAERSDCERHCRRVALCKREAQHGKLILGEKAPPADQACMHKCETRPDDFAKCEAAKRTCAAMRDCYGSYRD